MFQNVYKGNRSDAKFLKPGLWKESLNCLVFLLDVKCLAEDKFPLITPILQMSLVYRSITIDQLNS